MSYTPLPPLDPLFSVLDLSVLDFKVLDFKVLNFESSLLSSRLPPDPSLLFPALSDLQVFLDLEVFLDFEVLDFEYSGSGADAGLGALTNFSSRYM